MTNLASDQIYAGGRTHAEHCAWLDSLEDNAYRMMYMPRGHLFDLAIVSNWKHQLLTIAMTAGERLRILDSIAGCVYGPVTTEAILAIEPACSTGRQILAEISSIDVTRQMQAFSDGNVFELLARLNPSLFRALELCQIGDRKGRHDNGSTSTD